MSGMIDLLQQTLDSNQTEKISRQIGADPATTNSAIAMALPVLLAGLARNAQTNEGAGALHGALSKDHDGGILDQLSGFLGNAQSGPGDGILGHVLGARREPAQQAISKSTGLDAAKVSQLLVVLAPVVMGALGKMQRQRGLDANGLSGMLGAERERQAQESPGIMGLATKLLDQNNDGSVIDDLTRGLGGMLRGR